MNQPVNRITGVSDCASLIDHLKGLKSLGRERYLIQFLAVLREGLARCWVEAMIHCASLAQLGDQLTKKSDGRILGTLLEKGSFVLWTTEKSADRIARTGPLQEWSSGNLSYYWGRVPEMSGLTRKEQGWKPVSEDEPDYEQVRPLAHAKVVDVKIIKDARTFRF